MLTAASANEAIAAISEKEFDLVLSDIRMPGKNGVEAVAEIQARLLEAGKKDLPIIFITGYSDLSASLKAPFHGEVLQKPVDNERLLFAVRDYL